MIKATRIAVMGRVSLVSAVCLALGKAGRPAVASDLDAVPKLTTDMVRNLPACADSTCSARNQRRLAKKRKRKNHA